MSKRTEPVRSIGNIIGGLGLLVLPYIFQDVIVRAKLPSYTGLIIQVFGRLIVALGAYGLYKYRQE